MPSSFVFRFEKVLDWYKKREEEEEKKLAKLKMNYMEEESKLRIIEREKELGEIKLLENIEDINLGIIIRFYIERKKEDIKIQNDKLRVLSEEIAKQRDTLLLWEKKKKSMEKLKERDLFLYELKLKKLEDIILDENGIARYLRRDEIS
ncbi:TPA: hypothetical protein GXX44_03870 [bacterium]|jgi:flagellar export protein FliJ|nr:hypothetical protein [bacterium]